MGDEKRGKPERKYVLVREEGKEKLKIFYIETKGDHAELKLSLSFHINPPPSGESISSHFRFKYTNLHKYAPKTSFRVIYRAADVVSGPSCVSATYNHLDTCVLQETAGSAVHALLRGAAEEGKRRFGRLLRRAGLL